MKKTAAFAAAAAAFLAAAATAEAAPVRWQGEMMITGMTGSCPDYDPTGSFMRVRYRPGIGGDNGTVTRLSMFAPRNAQSLAITGLPTTAFKTAQTMNIGDGFGPFDNAVALRITAQSPATISAATDFILAKGEIRGWDFMPLCTAIFKMTLSKRL
jgi:hypothetical protein